MSVTNDRDTGSGVSAASLKRIADMAASLVMALNTLDPYRSWSRMKDREREEAIEKMREAARVLNDQVAIGEARGEPVTATCAGCGAEFVPLRRADARYHSAACRQAAYRRRKRALHSDPEEA
jgi:hypothetical protein